MYAYNLSFGKQRRVAVWGQPWQKVGEALFGPGKSERPYLRHNQREKGPEVCLKW
jgi:hypothetical protein